MIDHINANSPLSGSPRLPEFTELQRARLVHSIDFLGLNHYTTKRYLHRGEDSDENDNKDKEKVDVEDGRVYSMVRGVKVFINITKEEHWLKTAGQGWFEDQKTLSTQV